MLRREASIEYVGNMIFAYCKACVCRCQFLNTSSSP